VATERPSAEEKPEAGPFDDRKETSLSRRRGKLIP
jgi:hypothetical protein